MKQRKRTETEFGAQMLKKKVEMLRDDFERQVSNQTRNSMLIPMHTFYNHRMHKKLSIYRFKQVSLIVQKKCLFQEKENRTNRITHLRNIVKGHRMKNKLKE